LFKKQTQIKQIKLPFPTPQGFWPSITWWASHSQPHHKSQQGTPSERYHFLLLNNSTACFPRSIPADQRQLNKQTTQAPSGLNNNTHFSNRTPSATATCLGTLISSPTYSTGTHVPEWVRHELHTHDSVLKDSQPLSWAHIEFVHACRCRTHSQGYYQSRLR